MLRLIRSKPCNSSNRHVASCFVLCLLFLGLSLVLAPAEVDLKTARSQGASFNQAVNDTTNGRPPFVAETAHAQKARHSLGYLFPLRSKLLFHEVQHGTLKLHRSYHVNATFHAVPRRSVASEVGAHWRQEAGAAGLSHLARRDG